MTTAPTAEEIADAEILDGELHTDSRLRYIQRRMQEDEGVRLSIDNVSYVLRLNADFERTHGLD